MNQTIESRHLDRTWWILRLTFGLVPIVAGLDKFTNLLTDWTAYLSPTIASALPFSPSTFMGIVGVIEIVAGLVVLSRFTRFGGYLVAAWLTCIALNLLATHHFDIAVRDLVMATGAFTLARLTELRATATATDRSRAARGGLTPATSSGT
ncbi:MAG TPA: DoxX family membrane protein [Kofleriaceae bacterium]|nr:DoxX family membrane protein [Kofleriaceae bacterium]